MSTPVSVFLIPAEGLAGVLTPARLASLRAAVVREDPDAMEDEEVLLALMDHLSQHGGAALTRLPEPLGDELLELFDVLAEDLVHADKEPRSERLELASSQRPDADDLQAAEAVIRAACPDTLHRLWRYTVWGRVPPQEGAAEDLQRINPNLGYWTHAEVRQLREGLREHLDGAPTYQPVSGWARFTSRLRRIGQRGDPARAFDAVTQALDKASRQGAGLLFAR
ncbi:hypothetical protein LXT21_29330 [Myxococcus sp. K38C18041901]|uniref:hypothetical protein n=1 Tax=Myxococcus guangdongensis TaxID=2906760 RepID=UPI0020A7AF88|nr:hypothetical protein [Myxococcus guangdongensis]MCP3062895.1 hypothetical protein [Myxococcus guangdongensis]